MNKLKLNTKDDSLREILSSGKKYFVPRFQRDYSWEDEQLETLWQDVQEMIKNKENYHYMGYLVMQPNGTNKYKIIDGQQRLTTFSLFILACIKRLKEMNYLVPHSDGVTYKLLKEVDLWHIYTMLTPKRQLKSE